jgi:DNA-binding CsgD family transcriptional regulator
MAEIGIPCRLGQSFPLDEGATGRAVTSRMPVVIDDYSRLRHGHLPASHPASHGTVVAAPLWWRDQVIGVNVAFVGRTRTFETEELDEFEALTQSVAPAVVQARRTVPSLAGLLREHGRVLATGSGVQTVVTEVGDVRPVSDGVATAAVDILAAVHQAAARREAMSRLRVAVVHRDHELRLLVQDETGDRQQGHGDDDPLGLGASTWHELLRRAEHRLDGEVAVEHVSGWGTLVRADFPTATARELPPHTGDETPSSLTVREREVLALLADGLSDREVAARLVISPRTVEKHVGAAMRKTGAHTRTGAVVRATELGLLPLRRHR